MKRIADGVYSIGQRKGGHVHAFLLEGDSGLTLIDTLYDIDAHLVLDAIGRINKEVADLEHILLTHGHRSHLGGLAFLKIQSGAIVYAHEWEMDIIAGERTAQPVPMWPMRPLKAYWRVYHLQLGAALGRGKHPPCPVDRPLKGGEQVGPVQVIHTPGHSPGHLAFYCKERKILFVGDAIVTYPVFSAGWPAFTLNPMQHQDSLRRIADLVAEHHLEVVAVGHGEPIVKGAAERVRALAQSAGKRPLEHGGG